MVERSALENAIQRVSNTIIVERGLRHYCAKHLSHRLPEFRQYVPAEIVGNSRPNKHDIRRAAQTVHTFNILFLFQPYGFPHHPLAAVAGYGVSELPACGKSESQGCLPFGSKNKTREHFSCPRAVT